MGFWVLIGWVGAIIALTSYGMAIRSKRPIIFHAGNVVGSIMLIGYDFSIQAWPALFLSLSFGLVGGAGILRSSKEEQQKMGEWLVDKALLIVVALVLFTVGSAAWLQLHKK